MDNILKDDEYLSIVEDILNNKEFNKTKNIVHHGTSRYEHSLKVSYQAYKLAKLFKLDIKKTARAGLLHDFFCEKYSKKLTDKIKTFINHPISASMNSKKIFNISIKEQNIIESHMFPFSKSFPKYKESFIVTYADKQVAFREFYKQNFHKLSYITNLWMLYLINSLR